jgi:hypothetical protein
MLTHKAGDHDVSTPYLALWTYPEHPLCLTEMKLKVHPITGHEDPEGE